MHDSQQSTEQPKRRRDDARRGSFPQTSWTLIRQASDDPSSPSSREALQTLFEGYWLPVYLFFRRSGVSAELASDCTQSFFEKVQAKNTLSKAEPTPRAKFRSWLLKCAQNHLRDELSKESRHAVPPGIDPVAEARFEKLASTSLSAEQLYDQQCAHVVIAKATVLTRKRHKSKDRHARFELLRGHLPCGPAPLSNAQLESELGISPEGVRKAVCDLRALFKEDLRTVVSSQGVKPEDIDAELRALRDALAPESDGN